MKKTLLAGGIAAIMIAGVAVAAPGDRASRFDPNGDGTVTIAEIEQRSAERFRKLDADNDGRVTRAEADSAREQRHARRAEMRGKRSGDLFARMDANGDGSVTRAEFDTAREQRRAKRAEMRGQRGEHKGGLARHRGHRGERGDILARMDANGDGAVTLTEFSARSTERLQRLDADRNGQVSREEFAAARSAMKAKRRQAD